MTNHRNFVAVAAALADKICASDLAMRARRDAGLLTAVAARPWIYVHHDNGVARQSYEDACNAVAADRVALTVLRGIRATV